MTVLVIIDDGHDYSEFTYDSNFNRINAKGIKEEIQHEMYKEFGKSASKLIIKDFYRID